MIRSLRVRHRRVIPILIVLLPPMFFLGLDARRDVPVMEQLPMPLQSRTVPRDMQLVFSSNQLWPELEVTTLLFKGQRHHLLALLPDQPLIYPDLLLYWSGGYTEAGQPLPEDGQLLGSLSNGQGGRFEFSNERMLSEGALVLYSLGLNRIISVAELPENYREFKDREHQ